MISVTRFSPDDEPAIRAFNERLAARDAGFQFPTHIRDLAVPNHPGAALWTDMWLARDESCVRGGFLLKHERLLTENGSVEVGNYQLPLSEGIVDRRYATVGLSLTHRAISEKSALYCLGMGGLSRPLPQLLRRLGWGVEEVPFFFRVVRGSPFARHIRVLQTSTKSRLALRVLDRSGAAAFGALGWRLAASVVSLRRRAGLRARLTEIAAFDQRADQTLQDCKPSYAALLERSSDALNIKFPPGDPRVRRFILESSGQNLGWLVLTASQLHHHKQFGDLKLGCIVDGLLEPRVLPTALGLAADKLTDLGAELLVSNQTHTAWQQALQMNLFARGPSNFILARSRAFAPDLPLTALHMNRGDGDGPINL